MAEEGFIVDIRGEESEASEKDSRLNHAMRREREGGVQEEEKREEDKQRKRGAVDKEGKSQPSQDPRAEDQGSACLKWQDYVEATGKRRDWKQAQPLGWRGLG